jgi:carbohydrate-binding DOMON domain-containing protein
MKATASSMRTGRKYTVRAKEWLVGGKFPGSDQVAVTTTVNVNVFAAGTVASKGWE